MYTSMICGGYIMYICYDREKYGNGNYIYIHITVSVISGNIWQTENMFNIGICRVYEI